MSRNEKRKQPEFRAYDSQKNIWAQEGRVTAEWMKLQNEKLYELSSFTKWISGYQISKDEIGEALGVWREKERCLQGYSVKPQWKKKPHMVGMGRWKDHTKVEHNKNVWKGLQYTNLARDRDKWRAHRNIWLPYSARNLTSYGTASSSTRTLLQGITRS